MRKNKMKTKQAIFKQCYIVGVVAFFLFNLMATSAVFDILHILNINLLFTSFIPLFFALICSLFIKMD